jgi:hypothetical protein
VSAAPAAPTAAARAASDAIAAEIFRSAAAAAALRAAEREADATAAAEARDRTASYVLLSNSFRRTSASLPREVVFSSLHSPSTRSVGETPRPAFLRSFHPPLPPSPCAADSSTTQFPSQSSPVLPSSSIAAPPRQQLRLPFINASESPAAVLPRLLVSPDGVVPSLTMAAAMVLVCRLVVGVGVIAAAPDQDQ